MSIKGILPSVNISARGLSAVRRRLDAVASNLANAQTTRVAGGGAYQRRIVLMRQSPEPALFPSLLREESGKLTTTHDFHLDTYRIPDLRGQLDTPVVVANTANSTDQPRLEFDPDHPDADARGYVAYPNINIVQEMVDMITATRAFDANVTVIEAAKEIARKSLEI